MRSQFDFSDVSVPTAPMVPAVPVVASKPTKPMWRPSPLAGACSGCGWPVYLPSRTVACVLGAACQCGSIR